MSLVQTERLLLEQQIKPSQSREKASEGAGRGVSKAGWGDQGTSGYERSQVKGHERDVQGDICPNGIESGKT